LYFHSHPWENPAQPPGQTDILPCKKQNKTKKLNNKQGTEKETCSRGSRVLSKHTGERGKGKKLISTGTFSKQRLKRQKG
jgi:hypothetical protein